MVSERSLFDQVSKPSRPAPARGKVAYLEVAREIQQVAPEILQIYIREVLPNRTRPLKLYGRKHRARILKTMLGHEVKMGRKRVQCPDVVTARYLKVFGELGMKSIELPYDPTRTARLVDVLEVALQRIAVETQRRFPRPEERLIRNKLVRFVYHNIRRSLYEASRDHA